MKQMKILFIGELIDHSRCLLRNKAFMSLGHDVTSIKTFFGEYTSFIEKLTWKLGLPIDSIKLNKSIKRDVAQQDYDVIWIEKGNTLFPWTIKKMREKFPTAKIVSYSEDDMYAIHNRSWFYTFGLKFYDLVFTTKSYNINELKELGAKEVVFVDKLYDENAHKPIELKEGDIEKFGADVGFIGTFEKERAGSMLFLAKKGIKVRIWGNGWDGWTGKHENLVVENRPLLGEDYQRGICATKINLCFLRKANRDLQTDRTMEIPACAAFMLAERTNEHTRLFKEDEEAAYFESDEELLDKVNLFLNDDDKRKSIARRGFERCLKSGYSNSDGLKQMLLTIKSLP
ncbi:MAG: glycosyltransferase [Sedimenticola sp.]